jgi:hypothetical protein
VRESHPTGELDIEAFASWTIDGGGESDTTEITEVCHEVPPETEEPPIEVGGVSAERPAAAAEASPPSPGSPGRRHRGHRRSRRSVTPARDATCGRCRTLIRS